MTTPPRIGRPPKKFVGSKRSNVNFAINAQLRRELVEAAARNNRSLGAQIELYIANGLAAEAQDERMRRRVGAIQRGELPSAFDPTVTEGPLTPEQVARYAAVDRGVTPEQLDARLQAERERTDVKVDAAFEAKRAEIQRMVDAAMRKSLVELIAPKKKDDAA